jgi:hypothetical protein
MFVTVVVLNPERKPIPDATTMVYARSKEPGRGDNRAEAYPALLGQGRTDGSGRFRLDTLRTSSARNDLFGVTAHAPGHSVVWVKLDPDAEQPSAEIILGAEQVSVEGRLFDVQGRPVRDVTVAVSSIRNLVPRNLSPRDAQHDALRTITVRDPAAERQAATSDAEGRFTLRGFRTNVQVELAVDHPRFARLIIPVDTGDASDVKRVNIALEAAKVITGRVTYADTGKPVHLAQINVLSPIRNLYYSNKFETDADGRFRANPMSSDHYRLSVAPPEGQPYLNVDTNFRWPKGALEYSIDVVLPGRP